MVKFNIHMYTGNVKDTVNKVTSKNLRVIKDFLRLFSGCNTTDIEEYNGQENRWFGDYLVEVVE